MYSYMTSSLFNISGWRQAFEREPFSNDAIFVKDEEINKKNMKRLYLLSKEYLLLESKSIWERQWEWLRREDEWMITFIKKKFYI